MVTTTSSILSRVGDLLMRPTAMKAQDLHSTLTEALSERERLDRRQQELSQQRFDLLMTGGDEALDAVERELAQIQRSLDRHDVRIPELRRRLSEAQSAEQAAANAKLFDEAARDHLDSAERIDAALANLEVVFQRFADSGARLHQIDEYHGAGRLDAMAGEGRPDGDRLRMAILANAPTMARGLRIEEYGPYRREPFAPFVRTFWNSVATRLGRRLDMAEVE